MKRTADRLFGDQYQWSVLGGGRNQMYIATQSAVMGGNVRVGLEDSLWIGKGQLAKTNADQVSKIRRILEELGLEIATPDDARADPQAQGQEQRQFLSDGGTSGVRAAWCQDRLLPRARPLSASPPARG